MPDSTSGIVFCLFATALLVALWLVRGGVVTKTALVLAGISPPLFFVFLGINSVDLMGDLRLELQTVHFSGNSPVKIGSDPAVDHLVIAQRDQDRVNLGDDFATLQWRGCAPVAAPCLRQNSAARARGLIKLDGRLLGAQKLTEHAVCAGNDRIGYDRAANWLTLNGRLAGPSLPLEEGKFYQLRDLVGAGGESLAMIDAEGTMWSVAAGSGTKSVPVLQACNQANQSDKVIGLSGRLNIAIYLVQRPLAGDVSAARVANRHDPKKWLKEARIGLIERRSLTVKSMTSGITLALDTPDSFRIPQNREARRRLRNEGGRQISLGDLGPVLLGSTIEELRFPLTGEPLAGKLFQLLDLCTGDAPCECKSDTECKPEILGSEEAPREAESVLQPNLIDKLKAYISNGLASQFSDRVEIFGARAGDHITVRIRSLDQSYFLFFFAFWGGLAALVLSPLLTHAARKVSPALFSLVLLIELLLLMRLIIAFEAALISPNQRNDLALLAAPMALFAVPLVLAAIVRQVGALTVSALPYWAGVSIAVEACLGLAWIGYDWVGQGSFGSYPALYLALIGLALGAYFAPIVAKFYSSSRTMLQSADSNPESPERIGLFRKKALIALANFKAWPVWLQTISAASIIAAAMGAWVAWRKGADGLGYIILLLAIGWAVRKAVINIAEFPPSQRDESRLKRGAKFVVVSCWPMILPLGAIFIFFGLDAGLGLVTGCSMALVFCGLYYWLSKPGVPHGFSRWMAITSVVAICFLYLAALVAAPQQANTASGNPVVEAEVGELLQTSVSAERVDSRWLAFASPATLRQIGTRQSEQARAEFFQMSEYANQGLWGRGWLNQPNLRGMRFTHSTDFAPAVHVMTPFGRAGLAALLFVLCCAIWSFQRHFHSREEVLPIGAIAGLWMLLGGTLYVSLANIMLVPFTGRNIIMASPISVGDLFDGLALTMPAFILALWQTRATTRAVEEPA